MTNHATEALRLLNAMDQAMADPEPETFTTAEQALILQAAALTASAAQTHALLAIADAIREPRPTTAPSPAPCGQTRPDCDATYPCVLPLGHPAIAPSIKVTHIDTDGETWQ